MFFKQIDANIFNVFKQIDANILTDNIALSVINRVNKTYKF